MTVVVAVMMVHCEQQRQRLFNRRDLYFQCRCQSKIFNVATIDLVELLRSLRRLSRVTELCEEKTGERCWRKTGKDGDDWMSDGNEFQRSDAMTGNVRRPTVVSRNVGGTVS